MFIHQPDHCRLFVGLSTTGTTGLVYHTEPVTQSSLGCLSHFLTDLLPVRRYRPHRDGPFCYTVLRRGRRRVVQKRMDARISETGHISTNYSTFVLNVLRRCSNSCTCRDRLSRRNCNSLICPDVKPLFDTGNSLCTTVL